jgi:exopolyphosphatase/pppGpp-phosphohydrolase
MGAFTLAGTVFCRSNRKQQNPSMACEAYRQSTENLKSYMQRQWSLVGGMAGTFRQMEFVMQDESLRAEKGKRWQN